MKVEVYKPTKRETQVENEIKQAKADLIPVREKGRNDEINRKIRERYSLSEELAITRHALMAVIAHTELPEEYKAFAAFAEKCKQEADK